MESVAGTDKLSYDVVGRYIIKKNAVLMNKNGTTGNVSPTVGLIYGYTGETWEESVQISFNTNGGNALASIMIPTAGGVYQNLPTPTREHYIFTGWKYGDSWVANGSALPADVNVITLEAQWTPQPYTLNFDFKYEGWEVGSEPANTLPGAIEFNIETGLITLPTPTGTGTFVGWYKDAACTDLIISINSAELIELFGGNATIYGMWTSKQFTIKFENDHFGDVPYDNDTVIYAPAQLPTASLPTIPDSHQTDVTKDKYFEGWYYNGQKVTDFSFIDTSVSGEYTLTANWIDKVSITYTANNTGIYTDLITNGSATLEYGKAYWYMSGTTITLPNVTANDNVIDNASKLNYFISWTLNEAELGKDQANKDYTLSANTVINIVWGTKATVNIQFWDGKLTVTTSKDGSTLDTLSTSSNISSAKNYYFRPGTITVNYAPSETDEIIFKINDSNATRPYETTIGDGATIKIYADSNSSGCIVEGTMITLADGTQKKVEDLTHDDLLLIFNHETGKMEVGYVAMLDHLDVEREWANVINFMFSNGETLRMVWSHGVFDVTLNEYVLVNEDNYSEFVGHEFYSTYYNGSEFVSELVTLTDAFITNEYIKIYNPTSYWHMNYFANGILNVTAAPADHVGGHVNIFELDEDMKYDAEQMQADIEKYGLYTYDAFAEYLTEEQFYALPFAYLKVAVGKGNIDWESIMQIVEYIQVGSLLD